MAKLNIKQGKGFSKELAADAVGFVAPLKYDATIAYKNATEELGSKFDLATFAKEYLATKVKDTPNVGITVTLEAARKDTRQRPYTTDIVLTDGRRSYKTQYQLFVKKTNVLLDGRDTKAEALELAKDLVTHIREDVEVRIGKVVTVGEAIAATVTYTPSKDTKEGSYIFFSLED